MKRLAAAALVLLLLAVAVAVSTGGDDDESQARPSARAEYTRACQGYNSYRPVPATRHDEVLPGGAVIDGFRASFAKASAENVYSPRPGLEVIKAPVILRGDRDVTIAVPPSHQAVLGLDYAPERRGVDTVAEAHSSVRFRACRGGRGATGYAGGLLYTGPWPACVPVHVSVGGGRPVRHLLSLGAGRCQSPK